LLSDELIASVAAAPGIVPVGGDSEGDTALVCGRVNMTDELGVTSTLEFAVVVVVVGRLEFDLPDNPE
jgi:hypothetical protein